MPDLGPDDFITVLSEADVEMLKTISRSDALFVDDYDFEELDDA